MKVLLSIKPEYVDKILDGTKRYEFRKNAIKNKNVKVAVIYATMPVGMIVGEFDIDSIIKEVPEKIWSITQKYSGISKRFFEEYYNGREEAVAYVIGDVRRYERPLDPSEVIDNFTPPQSYMYIENDLSKPQGIQLELLHS